MLACSDIEQLVGAFVDSELPPTQLLEVARHAATCAACDAAIRRATALGRLVATSARDEAASLDLSGVWDRVEARIDTLERRRRWAHRATTMRGRAVPMWATALAIAAAAVFFLRTPFTPEKPAVDVAVRRPAITVAGTPRSSAHLARNLALIDRLSGRDVEIRRVPKDGTTVIWVNYSPEVGR